MAMRGDLAAFSDCSRRLHWRHAKAAIATTHRPVTEKDTMVMALFSARLRNRACGGGVVEGDADATVVGDGVTLGVAVYDAVTMTLKLPNPSMLAAASCTTGQERTNECGCVCGPDCAHAVDLL